MMETVFWIGVVVILGVVAWAIMNDDAGGE